MKTLAVIGLMGLISNLNADQMVNGYVRKDGTYVAPYMRTSPDNTNRNNYGTEGNVNPYTNQAGRDKPDDNPPMRPVQYPSWKTGLEPHRNSRFD